MNDQYRKLLHRVVGGEMDGQIVEYHGGPQNDQGEFNYGLPGMSTLVPLYTRAEDMRPITDREAAEWQDRRRKPTSGDAP